MRATKWELAHGHELHESACGMSCAASSDHESHQGGACRLHESAPGTSCASLHTVQLCMQHKLTHICVRICIVTLAETHPALQPGVEIQEVDFQISAGCSRLHNRVSGKAKRGGQFLTELAPLCRLRCSNGEQYSVYSCIRGKLVEVNERLLHTPRLLQEKPCGEGYIAVVLPKLEESKMITQCLLSVEEYGQLMRHRAQENTGTSG
uniref:Protein Abitram n=1 Tax=Eptatretus burgeri TaxID=7764 RepID=A0A8C4QM79_EPTBU